MRLQIDDNGWRQRWQQFKERFDRLPPISIDTSQPLFIRFLNLWQRINATGLRVADPVEYRLGWTSREGFTVYLPVIRLNSSKLDLATVVSRALINREQTGAIGVYLPLDQDRGPDSDLIEIAQTRKGDIRAQRLLSSIRTFDIAANGNINAIPGKLIKLGNKRLNDSLQLFANSASTVRLIQCHEPGCLSYFVQERKGRPAKYCFEHNGIFQSSVDDALYAESASERVWKRCKDPTDRRQLIALWYRDAGGNVSSRLRTPLSQIRDIEQTPDEHWAQVSAWSSEVSGRDLSFKTLLRQINALKKQITSVTS